jgi:hypothetical protein
MVDRGFVAKGRTKELVIKANSVTNPSKGEPQSDVRKSSVNIRTASKEQFAKAQLKTTAVHAGLFRRLAK